jgi:hypothetical protein
MTEAKKLKDTIRARARKTGESYTAARRQVLQARQRKTAPPSPPARAASPAAARKTALTRVSISEAGIVKATGRDLDHWFAVLDAFGAPEKGHTASARHLYDKHGVSGWHSQGITVVYERARGLRAVNQACNGKFQVSVSRVMPVSAVELLGVLSRPEKRSAWLKGADPSLRRALEAAFKGTKARRVTVKDENNARLRYPWDGSAVDISIVGKPNGKASIVASNEGLPGPEAVETRRALWTQALDGLRAHLSR